MSKLNIGWSHIVCGHSDDGEAELAEALPLIEQLNSYEGRAWYWLGRTMKHFWAADVEPFREYAERARSAAREVGEPVTEAIADSLIGANRDRAGRPGRGVARLEASRARTIAAGAGWALPRIDVGLARGPGRAG